MNALIIVSCLFAAAFAAPLEHVEPSPFELTHTSDVDGSYSYTFSSEDASKTETRTPQGGVRGAYSYVDDNGVLQKIQYVADENGFQVYGTNLPVGSTVPVKETPEVLEATAEHFALIDKHLKKVAIAQKLEAEYRAAHPELFEKEHHHIVHHVAPVVHHVELPTFHHHSHVEHTDEIPVAPEDEADVKYARAEHLAEVERITAEHFAAVAAAPKFEE